MFEWGCSSNKWAEVGEQPRVPSRIRTWEHGMEIFWEAVADYSARTRMFNYACGYFLEGADIFMLDLI